MKKLTFAIALFALLTAAESANAWGYHHGGHWHGHHHSHAHVGVFVGVPLGTARYYGSYYYPPVVMIPAPQIVYIEQQPLQAAAPQSSATPLPSGWWYYCPNPAGYYPYVKSCTQPWQPVEPSSPAPQQ